MDRDRFLASHNLHICLGELRTIKQAILDGRLWELVETRSRTHPALHTAFNRLLTYAENLEEGTPVRKKKGPFIFTETSLRRPEILRYQKRLLERYRPPTRATKLILFPESQLEPFQENSTLQNSLRRFERRSDVHICAYGLTFAVVPQELLDVYPLSQTESALSPTNMAINNALKRITQYLKAAAYARCLIFVEEPWQVRVGRAIRTKFRKKMKVTIIEAKSYDKQLFSKAMKALK
jgi:7-cyano-7-deazaguanine tRNA-ribosyltransferase